MVFTPTPQVYKVFGSIHMRISSWIYLLVITSCKFRFGEAQTHMKWFPHPFHTSLKCLGAFICCWTVAVYIFLPLPSPVFTKWQISWGSHVRYHLHFNWHHVACCIGWGFRPTWDGKITHYTNIYRVLDNIHMLLNKYLTNKCSTGTELQWADVTQFLTQILKWVLSFKRFIDVATELICNIRS